ncbi:hypothetical protein [Pararhodonellum marinum]|uniref:hypothetical protein n=1 Tax=Pararhodonellum marinum TaxID=2755358 RepID=UPI00188FE150|nr:hypothetical protein [Pararhodonellum marinum]
MHLKTEDITRLEIEFDSGTVPPPYSHQFKIKMNFSRNFINTQFDMHYTSREELEEEEILEEGFTMDDDYAFIGELPNVWEQPMKDLYARSKWTLKKSLDENGGIKILAKDLHGKIERSIPSNQKEWETMAQEFIQAIFEINKKEAPLSVKFSQNSSEAQDLYELTMKFSLRKAELQVNGKLKIVDWEEAKELLSFVYLPDYDYDQASEKTPTKRGDFIDTGDGLWYELGKGVVNIDDSFDALSKIRSGFSNLATS